jgi:hypothetical protein
MRELLFVALVLACPLMMVFMMRGGHGHGGANAHGDNESRQPTTDDLRRQRHELDRQIEQREHAERRARELAPTSREE